jgi:hypothetical protein
MNNPGLPSIQQSEYLRCQIDFTETMRILIRDDLHAKVYDDLATNGGSAFVGWKQYTRDQKVSYAYLEMIYELFERVYVIWQQHWIPAEEWQSWAVWIDDVIHHPLFIHVYKDNIGMFDPQFEKYIETQLQQIGSSQPMVPPLRHEATGETNT